MLRVEPAASPSLLRCPSPRPLVQKGIQLICPHASSPSPSRSQRIERKSKLWKVLRGRGQWSSLAAAFPVLNSPNPLSKSSTSSSSTRSKEYFEIPWANLRSKVEPSFAERSVINHKDYLKNGKVIVSNAVDVMDQGVVTAEGRRVPYDYLVIATGHPYTTIRGRRDRLEKFQEDNQKIICSSSIMIVGGGATGVELAGEIAVDFPDKKLTLVHNGPRLLPFIGHRASTKAFEWLKSKNVKVLLEQSIDIESISEVDREFQTSTGEIVKADSYFLCVGKPVGSTWLRDSILKEYLDRNGRLMVDENFRIGGLSNIFAIGDITDIPELKQGLTAQRHALIVAKNLKMLVKGVKDNKLIRYKPLQPQAWISLGRRDAVVQYSFLTVSGFVPGMFRSRDLFIGKMRKSLGLE